MRKHPRKNKLIWICLLVILLIALIIWILFFKVFANVKSVVCKTQFGACPEKYSQVLGATTNPEEIASVLTQLSDVKSVKFAKKYDSTLEVYVTIRTPLGIINGLTADDTGILFGQSANSNLPRLTSLTKYELGQSISETELRAIKILSQVTGFVDQRFTSKLIDDTLFLTLDLGGEIVINVNQEDMEWSSPLQHILARSKIEGRAPRRIDLRFKNPVITF